jgi:hypothetical protein
MRLVITEKQLKELIRLTSNNQELKEQGTGEGAPEAGTSSDGEKKTGASKWESGVTRGPANQIGVSTWSEIVGSKISRGKANPLSEQETNSVVQILRPDGKIMNAPANTKIIGIFDQSAMDGSKFKASLRSMISKENGGLGNKDTEKWIPANWSKIIKLNSISSFKTPDNKTYRASFKHPKLEQFRNVSAAEFQQKFYAMYPEPNGWKFVGYYSDQGSGFVGVEVEKTFWEKWKYEILTGASILAAVLIPGVGGILVSIGIDLISAALQYSEGDTIGAGVSTILAFIPVIGKYNKLLNVPKETAEKLAKEFAPITSKSDLIAKVKTLPNKERVFMQNLLAENPDKLRKLIEKEVLENVTRENSIDVVKRLNVLIRNGQLDKVKATQLYNNLALRRFGFDLTASGLIIYGGIKVDEYLNKKAQQQVLQGMLPSNEDQQIASLAKKAKEQDPATYSMIIKPIFEKYGGMYDVDDENKLNKLRKIQKGVLDAFLKDPNSDLDVIADQLDKN